MAYIDYLPLLSDSNSLTIITRPAVAVYNDEAYYYEINGYTEDETVSFIPDPSSNGNGYIGYLKCTITATAATTLPVYYTKESWNTETPDETLTLSVGDNPFYFNRPIYRIGICEYDRSTLKRKSLNTNITSITYDGILEDCFRLFDSALNSTSLNTITKLELSKLDISKTTTLICMFQYCKNLTNIGNLDHWNTSKVTNISFIFNNCLSLTSVGDLSNWNTSNVTDMSTVFNSCYVLTSVGDLSNWNTSNVTNMAAIFLYCYALTSIGNLSNWNVSKVTNMSYMFNGCYALNNVGDLSNWDISNVTDMCCMFLCCYTLISVGDLSNWNVSKVTNIYFMFSWCYALTSVGDLSNWNVSKVTNMSCIFYNCYVLTSVGDLSNWDTSKVTTMAGLFTDCCALSNIGDLSTWNTEKVTTFEQAFDDCINLKLTGFKNWNISNVTNLHGTFRECGSIDYDELDFSSWDTSKVTNMNLTFSNQESGDILYSIYQNCSVTGIKHLLTIPKGCSTSNMFKYCWTLTTIGGSNTISASVSFSESPLTHASALVLLNALDSSNTGTLTFSYYTYNLLSSDDIAIGTNKGWTIVSASVIGKFKLKNVGSGSLIYKYDSSKYVYNLYPSLINHTDYVEFIFDDDITITGKATINSESISLTNNQTAFTEINENCYNYYGVSVVEYNGKIYRADTSF